MEQLKIVIREPTPEDYKRASLEKKTPKALSGEVSTSPLSEEEVEKLYKLVEGIQEEGEDKKDFFKREESVKIPYVGEVVRQSFPPPIKLEKPDALMKEEEEIRKELKVIRHTPEGKGFENVGQCSVTFNQPMIPVSTIEDISKLPLPVKIIPAVEGEWRWIGTKTVKWKAKHRLPKSTRFEVIVEKGAKSELGCELKETFSWSFTTVPVHMTHFTPTSSYKVGKHPPILLEFNQKIDPVEIMKRVVMSIETLGNFIPMNLEELKEYIDRDDEVMKKSFASLYHTYDRRIKNALPGQWVCFRFEKELPLSTSFTLSLPAGLPSKEGPLLGEKSEQRVFSTYGAFQKVDHQPRGRYANIVPNQQWTIRFTNPIDGIKFSAEECVEITPVVEGVKITPSGSSITIKGMTKGGTDYTVKIKRCGSFMDTYGQQLEEEEVELVFKVGRARSNLYGFHNGKMIVHDIHLNSDPDFELVTINIAKIRVCVFQVEPWEYHRSFCGGDHHFYNKPEQFHTRFPDPKLVNKVKPPEERVNCGVKVFDGVVEVKDMVEDELVLTKFPLSQYLQNVEEKCGQLVVFAEPDVESSWDCEKVSFRRAPRVKSWVQVTKLASDAICGKDGEIIGYCSQLYDGRTIPGVHFSIVPPLGREKMVSKLSEKSESEIREEFKKDYSDQVITQIGDEDGTILFPKGSVDIHNTLLVASKGADTCFVTDLYPQRSYERDDQILSYIKNDRNLYKPNETVSIKGIFRIVKKEGWTKVLEIPGIEDVKWTLFDPKGTKLKEGTVKMNEFGSFFAEVELPDNVNLGNARVRFECTGTTFDHYFQIQEFRTPEFTSKAKVEPGPYFVNGVSIVEGQAQYFSGGGLPGCKATWYVSQNATTFYPPSFTFKGFSFGCSYRPLNQPYSYAKRESFEGSTDGNGDHRICVEFSSKKDVYYKKPTCVQCSLNIQDISRQTMSCSTQFTVHPSRYYVGIKKSKYYARKGETLPLEMIVSDIDGNVITDQEIELSVYRRDWDRTGYYSQWKQIEKKVVEGKKYTTLEKNIPLEISDIKLDAGGTYYFVAKVVDDEGRPNFCSTSIWVAGGTERSYGFGSDRLVNSEAAKLIGNKTEYDIGDEAKILVTAPFSPADGLMILECNGFVEKKKFRVEEGSCVLTVPILKGFVPNACVSVFITGMSTREQEEGEKKPKVEEEEEEGEEEESTGLPPRPAFAQGMVRINVPPKKRVLEVEVIPDKKVMRPGDSGEVRIRVSSKEDETFSPGDKETAVSLIIVDEAVLSLTGYKLPHPIDSFVPRNIRQSNCRVFREKMMKKNWNSIVVESANTPYYSEYDDLGQTIVIDTGSVLSKFGYAGDDKCESMMTVVGRNTKIDDIAVGDDVSKDGSKLDIFKYPVERGMITNWNDIEKVWHHIFYNVLKVCPEEHPIVLTQPALNPKNNKEKMTSIMFETFNVPALHVENHSTLALYASGRTTGIVLDSGGGLTCTVPVYEGFPLPHAIIRQEYAGKDITDHLHQLFVKDQEFKMDSSFKELEVVRSIKEQHCYVAKDFEKELKNFKPEEDSIEYELPDGKKMKIGSEMFKAPELMFSPPKDEKKKFIGVHTSLQTSIMKCDVGIRKDMYANILLAGGNTMFRGFENRLDIELAKLVKMKYKISAPQERKISHWIGASILGSLSTFQNMYTTKDEYDDAGATIVHRKCFGGGPPAKQNAMAFSPKKESIKPRASKSIPKEKEMAAGEEEEEEVEGEEEDNVKARTDFRPLAVFVSDAVTNKEGEVVIPFKLPDSLTKYRVWVLAHHRGRPEVFGLGESSIQANLPVALRPSLPRMLNFGDECDFTVVVQNQTLEEVKVKVAVRMTNLRLSDWAEKSNMRGIIATIPKSERAELRFPVKTVKCGKGRFQVISQTIVMGGPGGRPIIYNDVVEKSVPIYTPCTSESFATYGEMDGDSTHVQTVSNPGIPIFPQFGGLKITTSSTALQSLTDAFLYLYHYRFDCVEQICSRILSINSLRSFLEEFNVSGMPSKNEIDEVMEAGFKKIKGTQRTDGAIGYWTISSEVSVYLSIHVAHTLIRCIETKIDVDETILNRSKAFCENVETYVPRYGSWYSEYTKVSLRALSMYVLTLYGVNGKLSRLEMEELCKEAVKLYKEKEKYLSHEGKVWLMFCVYVCSEESREHEIVKEILKFINENVTETASTANFITSYGDDGKNVMLHSNRRTDGIILEVLCHVDPKNSLIPKLVKGLLLERKKKGRWGSTQENVYILMAIKKYFEVFEGVTPDFLCRVWLGDEYAGEVKYKGREVDYKMIEIPMKNLMGEGEEEEKRSRELVLWKKGAGRMYYRIAMDYAPKSFSVKPVDYGFTVERTYEYVTNKDDVSRLEDGTWKFKPGELIRVKLRVTNVSRRYHVALVDYLPAGCEVLNPELKGTENTRVSSAASSSSASSSTRPGFYWWRKWYQHINLRDERVEVFSYSTLHCGTHEYSYITRATSLGTFVVPPAKAEEMYTPEIFGRTASEKVVIRN